MYDIILSFITAFIMTYLAIPSVIRVANVKNLFDEPGDRHVHTERTPSLGGIAIFAGTIFSITFWTPFEFFAGLQYILCALIIIFLIGAKDDILPMPPYRKFIGQIFAALILVFKAEVRITQLYGLLGFYEIPYGVSVVLSVLVIIFIVNSFNLIDGINGLAGSLGGIISLTFGIWFFLIERVELAIVAVALTGALIAFLKYNYTPAKIFMGDTGSLLIGLVCSMLALKFLESHDTYLTERILEKPYLKKYEMQSVPALVVGILIIPTFDTCRVFIMRILKGRSPFHPDKNHIHHLILSSGCSHMQATTILVITNIIFLILVYFLQSIGTISLIVLTLGLMSVFSLTFQLIARKRRTKETKHP